MGESKQYNLFKKIVNNIFIRNIVLIIITSIILIGGILFYLNRYTRHNESVSVPDVKGIQLYEAESLLTTVSLKFEVIDSIYQKDGIPGSVLDQVPKANTNVKEGRTVYLTIQATTEPLVNIPDLQYASLRQAEALLKAVGFTKPEIQYEKSEFRDLVLGVSYKGKTTKAGEKIPKSSILTILVGDGYSNHHQKVDSLSDEEIFEMNDYEE